MEYRIFDTYSTDYLQSLLLRYKILRLPLGLNFDTSDFEKDKKDIHIGLFDKGAIIATLTLTAIAPSIFKMRQVAVDSNLQQQGYGEKLLLFAENYALSKNINQIVCHARDTAVPFYENAGYSKYGASFTEVGITHFLMQKSIS